jgi:hypothetical protein
MLTDRDPWRFANYVLYISLQKNRLYVMPWVLCESASLLVQVVGLVFYIKHRIHKLDKGVLIAAVVNIGKRKLWHYH